MKVMLIYVLDKDDNIHNSLSRQKSWIRTRTRRFKEQLLESRIDLLEKNETFLMYFIFIFCMMTDRRTVKVSYILGAQKSAKLNLLYIKVSAVYLL